MANPPGIRLVFCAAPGTNPSPAVIGDVARSVTAGLRAGNQRIEPVYDGTRGGDIYQWLVAAAGAAQPLLPLASLILSVVQLINEVKKSTSSKPPDRQPPVVVVIRYSDAETAVPPDSDQALLERLLRERLPVELDPAQTTIEVQVAPPSTTL
ncbi:MAG: hypothetical protein NZ701_03180 [Roseiflexus sp.]|nr:hypothetical protein [Roseiflexus sp.]